MSEQWDIGWPTWGDDDKYVKCIYKNVVGANYTVFGKLEIESVDKEVDEYGHVFNEYPIWHVIDGVGKAHSFAAALKWRYVSKEEAQAASEPVSAVESVGDRYASTHGEIW